MLLDLASWVKPLRRPVHVPGGAWLRCNCCNSWLFRLVVSCQTPPARTLGGVQLPFLGLSDCIRLGPVQVLQKMATIASRPQTSSLQSLGQINDFYLASQTE